MDCRSDVAAQILLSGGNSMIRGLPDRLKAEVTSEAPNHMNIGLVADKDR